MPAAPLPHFGHPGPYRPGDTFPDRAALSAAGVHRPRRAGIGGTQGEGAESIVLADAYEDDEDHGDYLIYVGHGGRDPKTGRQTADQPLSPRNRALMRSHETGRPVRLIRKVPLPDGQATYSYDGLFRVTAFDEGRGRSGFRVWRFRLEALVPAP